FSHCLCHERGRRGTLWGCPATLRPGGLLEGAPMTHEDAFLLDIVENREDDTPRRIYADWLLDQPDPVQAARGEFIHVQCDLALRASAAAQARERPLLEAHGREWSSLFRRLGCRCWEYRRGFVEGVGMPAASFLAQAALLVRSTPLRELKLTDAA